MVALQIRDVPDEVRDALAATAAMRGQSLQAYLLTLVTEEARRSANVRILAQMRGRADGTRLSVDQVTRAIDESRRERE